MRRLVATLAVAGLAAGLSACGKSEQSRRSDAVVTSGAEQPSVPALSDADKLKVLASLPAPYSGGDLKNGKAKFALCSACHTIAAGAPNMTGPNLHRVIGRPAGSLAGYNFSQPLKTAGFTWDAGHLDPWVENPRGYIPGTKMTFAGLKAPKDRVDLIAYLMVESGYKPQ